MFDTISFTNTDSKLALLKLRDDIRSSLTYSLSHFAQVCYVHIEILSFNDESFCLSYTPFIKDQGFQQEQHFYFTSTTIPSTSILDDLVKSQFPELFI